MKEDKSRFIILHNIEAVKLCSILEKNKKGGVKMLWAGGELRRMIGVFFLSCLFVLVASHLSFAGDSNIGSTFQNLTNNFSTLLFNYIGEVLFVILFFAGLIVLPRNFTIAMILMGVAILLAVGPTIVKGIWDFFSKSSSGSSGFNTVNHVVRFASLILPVA